MNLDEKLQKKQYSQIWQEYCGFLDLSMAEYMEIQERLMLEQIELYSNCELGRHIMKNKKPATVEEYRQTVPLTTYEDYAEILLQKKEDALPSKPMLWIETTWEGGKKPVKVAPYTESMLRCLKGSFIAILVLATSNKRGEVTVNGGENFLNGMAPLPYLTGILPHVFAGEISLNFLPPTKEAEAMSFGQRSKVGFKMGMEQGVELFFGVSSVITKMGRSFVSGKDSSGGINIFNTSLKMNYRLLKAWIKSKKENKPIMPKDIWKLKGLICTGTDTGSFKKEIEEFWGVKPLEIFGGTEPTCIATETWRKNGMVLFPDVCFCEFIPKSEMEKNLENPSYVPNTYLMDELVEGNEYELVISSLKGGAFARYRVGDMLKCLSLRNEEDNIQLPHFAYVDREPKIIDMAGFTRISEDTISKALELSKLDIIDWFAIKDFDDKNNVFLHLYVEVGGTAGVEGIIKKDIIKEHLSIYFCYVDPDYKNLKTLLGMEPLVITIIPLGTIQEFYNKFGRYLRKINPSHYDVIDVLKIARGGKDKGVL